MKRNISGIYIIRNTINNKVYIGSAVCCKQRFIGHKSDFKNKKHNDRFQNFVNKYGIKTLHFDIIEYVSDKHKLIEREQYWINFYHSYKSKNGYNISKIAGSLLGIKMPKSHKDSCRKRMMGNRIRLNKKWTEQEKVEIGIRSRKMWAENPERLKSMSEKISKLKKGIPIWKNKKHPMSGRQHPNRKIVEIYKNNILIDTILGINEAANKYNLDPCAISKVCNGKSKSSKGYSFKFVEPSSKLCSVCGHTQKLQLSDRHWTCLKCGTFHDRDINAAKNIKAIALKDLSGGYHRTKQWELPELSGALNPEYNKSLRDFVHQSI